MRTGLSLAAGAAAFLIIATANSGGYRYGISDQAFYVPAIAHAADGSVFPRDAVLLTPQLKLWAGDEILALAIRGLGIDVPPLFVLLYVAGLLLLFSGGVFFARALGASWWTVAGATALLTLRHRIAKTGANSLEGYMHPRMIAFALGLTALGFILRRRLLAALGFVAVAAVVHPTTALWFGGVLAVAAVAGLEHRSIRNGLFMIPLLVPLAFLVRHIASSPRMDADWLAVLGEKDYLFSHTWPAYAWVTNLLYPLVILLLYWRRRSIGVAARGEGALIAGLLALVAGFLVSVPLAALRIAPIVQLQVNRVFWLLDAVAIVYVAWWLIDIVATRRRLQAAAAAVLVLLAAGRGVYILADTGRPLARLGLPADDWTEAMTWIRQRPGTAHVLADPGHVWKYGTSVRVAAMRDTVLEQTKDSAMAMYDRETAMRVSERARALEGFAAFSLEQFREVARRYDVDLLVTEKAHPLSLPQLYENGRFVIYHLR